MSSLCSSKKPKSQSLRNTPLSTQQRKSHMVINSGRFLDFDESMTARTFSHTHARGLSVKKGLRLRAITDFRGDPLDLIKHDRRLSYGIQREGHLVGDRRRLPVMCNLLPPIDVRITAVGSVTLMGESRSKVKEFNQDSYIALTSFCNTDKVHLFAVFDGHGEDGHHVAMYLKEAFPRLLTPTVLTFLKGHTSVGQVKDAIRQAFLLLQEELCQSLPLHTDDSGSTAVLTLLISDHLFCASVGDSRAVLGSKSLPWRVTPLTHDHRPESPREQSRITLKRGRVESKYLPEKEAFGPMRVWLPHKDTPGLAMSRSLGDAVVHEYGVTAEPDVVYRKLRGSDRMLLLASDGLWNFMENEEAISLASRFYDKRDADRCCHLLSKEATRRWKVDGHTVDDITVLSVFIN